MRGVNDEYIAKVNEILEAWGSSATSGAVLDIVEYFQEEIFQAICDARGD